MAQSSKPDVAIDLDELEREGGDKEPYRFRLGERVYELDDPESLDYRDLMAAFRALDGGDPELGIQVLVRQEDRDEFLANEIPTWKLQKLFEGYLKHFGLPSPGKLRGSRRS